MSSQAEQTESERRAEAVDILRQLAQGNDPQSGMSLDPTHVVNRSVNIRALLLGLESLQSKAMAVAIADRPERLGASSGKEDLESRELFRTRIPLQETATLHQRTRGGMGSRLVHLGLVESKHEARGLLRRPSDK